MKISKTLSKPNYIFGLPQMDFYCVVAFFMLGMMLVNLLLSLGVKIKYWGFLLMPIFTWVLYIYLRWGARQNQPGFIFSLLSHKWLQPHKLLPTNMDGLSET